MNKAFQTWRKRLRREHDEQEEGKEEGNGRLERERAYGIKHWGKVRTIPRINKQVGIFCKWGLDDFWAWNAKTPEMGASGPLRLISS
eukprot:3197289-Pleurochrysis_carterae.AAC.3